MMKAIHTIYMIFALLGCLAVSSCEDHAFDINGPGTGYGGTIAFDVSSGFDTDRAAARGGEPADDEGLPYIMLTSGSDTLYLHRYVAPESERATGNAVAASRDVQVNDIRTFLEVNGDDGFLVNAVFTDDLSEFFPLTPARPETSADGDVWVPDTKRYWPDKRELHFNALAPACAFTLLKEFTAGLHEISFDYTVPASDDRRDAERQPDLMFASMDYSHYGAHGHHSDLAPLNFRHALSAIKFAVRDVINGELMDISIKGVAGSGSCRFMDDTFTWSGWGETTDYTQVFGYETNDPMTETGNGLPSVGGSPVINDVMPEKTFMLIPQSIPDDAVLEITFRSGGVDKTLRGKLKTDDIPLWEPGKEYVYTISTSAENWTYVFDVTGSYRNGTEVYMPSPADETDFFAIEANTNYKPYYEVRSYRQRKNNPNVREPVPWSASHGAGVPYYYKTIYSTFAEKDAILYQDRDIAPSERDAVAADKWITDPKGLCGPGSVSGDRHDLTFYPASISTDWEGDHDMYVKEVYDGNSEQNPWDLSTFGGQRERNTANCYVVDREGWYALPLYYGNAITQGQVNSGAWMTDLADLPNKGHEGVIFRYRALRHFKDCNGRPIPDDGKITGSYYKSAHLLWQDAYGVIENVKLAKVKGEDMIVFHVSRENIQQGNALIGLSEHTAESWDANDPKIVWSWHIWINEHWLNDQGLSNAFATAGFDTGIKSKTDMQNQGDVTVIVPQEDANNTMHTYNVAPYNIGWCDAKNVLYLSRYNEMNFVQYKEDGVTRTGNTAVLPLIQDGRTIEYKYGNNVYFQFGRKDPFVGFVNHESTVKDNFGDLDYEKAPQLKSIAYSIQHPHQLFVGAEATENGGAATANNDWNVEWDFENTGTRLTEYYNLWNNYPGYDVEKGDGNVWGMKVPRFFNYRKTVYDPSPAGYTVPPAGFFKILFKSPLNEYSITDSYYRDLNSLNGRQQDIEGFLFRIYSTRNSEANFFSLTSTGHRWYANSEVGAGNNYNPNIVYLWTNHVSQLAYDRGGLSAALGAEQKSEGTYYIISPAFRGRKSMARPIRCIRESNEIRN